MPPADRLLTFALASVVLVVVPGPSVVFVVSRAIAHGRRAALRSVATALGLRETGGWNDDQRNALRAMAPVLAQIKDLHAWPAPDKRRLVALIRAKGGDEYRYFALMADFAHLRNGLNAAAENSAT